MRVEDYLASGESVIASDGGALFTDRRLFLFSGSSFEALPYAHVSHYDFERKVPLLPIVLGVVVLVAGLFLWGEAYVQRSAVIQPDLFLALVLVFAVILIGVGLALTRRGLTFFMDSGKSRYLTLKEQTNAEELMRLLGDYIRK